MVLWRYNEHPNPLQGLLRHRFLGPSPRVSDPADLRWGLRTSFPWGRGSGDHPVLNNSTVSNYSLIETGLSYLSFTLFLLCPFGLLAPYISWSMLLSFLSWGFNCWFDDQISHTWEPTWASLQSPVTKRHTSLEPPQWHRRLLEFLLKLHDNTKPCSMSSFKGSPLHIGATSYFQTLGCFRRHHPSFTSS